METAIVYSKTETNNDMINFDDVMPYGRRILLAECRLVKVKSSMAWSLPVENLLAQNVGSIINYLQ